MSEYSEKLKNPKWQKRRLEIMKRDNFTCRFCGNKDETLNVHHVYYFGNMDPWEADDGQLITLCESYHLEMHENNNFNLIQAAAILIFRLYRNEKDLFIKCCYNFHKAATYNDPGSLRYLIANLVNNTTDNLEDIK